MLKRNLKLTLEYDGTDFKGWQIQKGSQRTVQGELEKALTTILKEDVRVIGSGRTDTGVHALGQTANFKTTSDKARAVILKALNGNLPDDIAVINVEEVPSNFHAQYAVKSKTYRYTILNRFARSPFNQKYALYFPYHLNLTAMRKEAKAFLGQHDFKSFQGSNSSNKKKNTIRTIYRLEITKRSDFITVEIEANGFLYKMVRNIVGALLKAGTGHLLRGSVKEILAKKNRRLRASPAKACGLMLWKVKY